MPSLFLFKGNLKDHLSFAKHVIWSTVDFVLDLRLAASRILKDSVKYYCGVANWQEKASTETPEHALIKKVSKEETIASDPFRVRLSFSLAEKLKMTIFGVFLVPIRFISAFLALNLAWALSSIGLLGLDNSNPVTGWRKQLQRVIHALGRFCCNCFGFQVSKTGTQVIASHSRISVTLCISLPNRCHNLRPQCLLLLRIRLFLTRLLFSILACHSL